MALEDPLVLNAKLKWLKYTLNWGPIVSMFNSRLVRFWSRFAVSGLIVIGPIVTLLLLQPDWLAFTASMPWWYGLGLTPLVAGLAGLWHWQQERRYLARGRDVQHLFNHMVCLAELPPLHHPQATHLLLGPQDDETVTEAFRTLYASVRLAFTFSNQQYLLVTSAERQEGKSLVAANLAQASAWVGRRVLLVEGHWDAPTVHHYFGLSRRGRLGSLLQQVADMVDLRTEARALVRLVEARPQLSDWLNRSIQPTTHPNLFVLSNGSEPLPTDLRHPVLMRGILEAALTEFDLVICDGPPMLGKAEGWRSLAVLGEVLLVAAAYHTRRAEMRAILEMLRRHPISPIGVVLNHRRPDAIYPKAVPLTLSRMVVEALTPLAVVEKQVFVNGNGKNGTHAAADLATPLVPYRNGKSETPVTKPAINGHHFVANGVLDAAAEQQRIMQLERALALKEAELEQIFQAQTVQNDLFAQLQQELTEQKEAYRQLQLVYREQNEDFFRLEQNARTRIQGLEQKLAHLQTRFQQASVTLYRRFQENNN